MFFTLRRYQMAPPRRRKGKQSSGGSRSVTPVQLTGEKEKELDQIDEKVRNSAHKNSTHTKMTGEKQEKGDDVTGDKKLEMNSEIKETNDNAFTTNLQKDKASDEDSDSSLLVLTSEKRRGIYECDYCHSDISQQPRIRCAVCSDFDLCLDCFATTDHAAMMTRIKAATQTQTELNNDGIHSNSILGVAISSAAANHEAHHCYRVCDSTRYPLFPVGRITVPTAAGTKGDKIENKTEELDGKHDKCDGNDTTCINLEQEHTNESNLASVPKNSFDIALPEDPKVVWTAEEDLRLVDAIQTHGLGNWVDIAEAIGGEGSVGKSPKRCMERYLDDFLGRYGHILPSWTVVDDYSDQNNVTTIENIDSNSNCIEINSSSSIRTDIVSAQDTIANSKSDVKYDMAQTNKSSSSNNVEHQTKPNERTESGENCQLAIAVAESKDNSTSTTSMINTTVKKTTSISTKAVVNYDDNSRTSKRRNAGANMKPTNTISGVTTAQKRLKVARTESFSNYHNIWPPYLPAISGAEAGKEVARDLSYKAEQAFVKSTLAVSSKEEADKIHQDWVDNKMNKIGSPTVLPPRPCDSAHLVGSEMAGFMPRRGDFDVEWENDAEAALADMEFIRSDTPEDKKLKLRVLQIYYEKQDEREKRKKFILSRHLYDYRKYIQDDRKLPVDERDLVHRMRLFERFHTPDEHKRFITDILKAKRLRKEIAKLQMYRRIGIRTEAEAEMYELDKNRRQFHKSAHDGKMKKITDRAGGSGNAKGAGTIPNATLAGTISSHGSDTGSLWKQYKTNDRSNRRSMSRLGSSSLKASTKVVDVVTKLNGTESNLSDETQNIPKNVLNEDLNETIKNETTGKEFRNGDLLDTSRIPKEIGDVMEFDFREVFDLSNASCRDLLSRKELALCERLHIYPTQYLDIKKALIHESLVSGLLDKNSSSSDKHTIVKIDVKRRGDIVDFFVKSGWITRNIADGAMQVVTPQPTS